MLPSYVGTMQLTRSPGIIPTGVKHEWHAKSRLHTQGFGVVYQWLPYGYESDGWKARMVNTIGELLPPPSGHH